jgi:hypothetical protein
MEIIEMHTDNRTFNWLRKHDWQSRSLWLPTLRAGWQGVCNRHRCEVCCNSLNRNTILGPTVGKGKVKLFLYRPREALRAHEGCHFLYRRPWWGIKSMKNLSDPRSASTTYATAYPRSHVGANAKISVVTRWKSDVRQVTCIHCSSRHQSVCYFVLWKRLYIRPQTVCVHFLPILQITLEMFILPFLFPYVLYLRIFFLPIFPFDFLCLALHVMAFHEWLCICYEIKVLFRATLKW